MNVKQAVNIAKETIWKTRKIATDVQQLEEAVLDESMLFWHITTSHAGALMWGRWYFTVTIAVGSGAICGVSERFVERVEAYVPTGI